MGLNYDLRCGRASPFCADAEPRLRGGKGLAQGCTANENTKPGADVLCLSSGPGVNPRSGFTWLWAVCDGRGSKGQAPLGAVRGLWWEYCLLDAGFL